ncbi:MAG: LacI family DNA-binding transcriptional regulator [Chloroflexota bacterium]
MSIVKKVTIQDIAQKADVSISTVSRVLNGRVAVAEAKKTAVLKAVKDLGYRPNVFAQSLASGQSMTIGILTQEIRSMYYDELLHHILQELRDTSYSAIIADGHWQVAKGMQALNTLLDRQVDGLILIGGSIPEQELIRINQTLPLIIAGRHVPGLANQCVYIDNFSGAYKATKYLIDLGHRHIAHITGKLSQIDAIERCNGYKHALEESGIVVDENLIIEGHFHEQSGLMAVEMLLTRANMFTAIFCGNDQMAYGAKLALFRRGIRVPDDISLIGFDDQSMSAYTIPPLTTMRQPAGQLGRAAAHAILNLMKNEPFEIRPFEARMIVRESTSWHR